MLPPVRGPRRLPLVGHLPWIARDPVNFFAQISRRYGDVVPLRIGVTRALYVNRPDLIAKLVRDRNCHRSDESRSGIRSFVGEGLLAIEGSTHLRHRRLMAPAFHRERFREYGALMCAEAQAEVSRWRSGETRDMRADMMRLTFAIVSKALFSADTRDEARSVGAAMEEILPWLFLGATLAGVFPWLPIFYPPRARASIKRLKRLVREIIARRRREGGERGDLLSMLLATRDEDGSALSDEDICDEALTLLIAGHDTTANTLLWACHLLTQNPAIQEAVAAEVRGVLGDRRLTPELLPKLPLVQQVIDETLRLYPVVWVGDRVPQRDIQLGPYDIQAGTRVMFSMYTTQRDARFFHDPLRFDPSRFTPERAKTIPEGAYLPFGAGVHMCIGTSFALMETRTILATILQRFSMHAVPGHKVSVDPQIVLTTHGGLPLTLHAHDEQRRHDGSHASSGPA